MGQEYIHIVRDTGSKYSVMHSTHENPRGGGQELKGNMSYKEAYAFAKSQAKGSKYMLGQIKESFRNDDASRRIRELSENMEGSKKLSSGSDGMVIAEGTAPKNSVYGALMPMAEFFLKALKKGVPSKYLKFKITGVSAGGIWIIEFDGVSRSDITVDGYMYISSNLKNGNMEVECQINDVMKGRNERKWSFYFGEDYSPIAKSVADHIKEWVEL